MCTVATLKLLWNRFCHEYLIVSLCKGHGLMDSLGMRGGVTFGPAVGPPTDGTDRA